MLALKYLLMLLGFGLFGSAGALVAYDVYLSEKLRRLINRRANGDADSEEEEDVGMGDIDIDGPAIVEV